jgi:hypothetical protein
VHLGIARRAASAKVGTQWIGQYKEQGTIICASILLLLKTQQSKLLWHRANRERVSSANLCKGLLKAIKLFQDSHVHPAAVDLVVV